MSRNEPVDPRVRLAIARWPDDAPRGAVTTFCAEQEISRKTFYALRARARAEGSRVWMRGSEDERLTARACGLVFLINKVAAANADIGIRATVMRTPAGADIILGAQSHTLQPVDLIDLGSRKTLVIYSLANFLASQGAFQAQSFAATSVIFYVGLARDARLPAAPLPDAAGARVPGPVPRLSERTGQGAASRLIGP